MASVLGVGGVFFKSKDPAGLMAWYRDVLGLEVEQWGGVVFTPDGMAAHPGAGTVFSPFEADTTYFDPSTKDFMINLAVDDLDGILASCAAHGVEATVLPDQPNGRFAHILDPEGTKIELWQPKPMPA
jgi:predicted enzyme related to lactoylglutathione lyase